MTVLRFLAAVLTTGALLAIGAPAAAAAPDTTITSGPADLTASRTATFRFSSNVRRATFQCKLDARAWGACESPKRYRRLTQGPHSFQVRARKAGVVDPSPAVRTFTVDTVKPDTTIDSGPTGWVGPNVVTADHSPGFTFSSSEEGSSFECRLATLAFEACGSPFAPSTPLPDGDYTFAVRAIDAAGNVDATPATRAFRIVTPITKTLETAQAAAELLFPDSVNLDVPANCGDTFATDCPGGAPRPPSEQLATSSRRTVLEVAGTDRYDVTVTTDVQTLEAIKLSTPFGGECDLTMTSANATTRTWTVAAPLTFYFDSTFGDRRIRVGDPSVSGVEEDDYAVTGGGACQFFNVQPQEVAGIYAATLQSYIDEVGNPICAAPGPAYLGGPCQQ